MRALVALLLLAGGLAAAAPTSIEMSMSSCYDCHAPGLWIPPMVEPKVAEYRFVPDGDSWWLEADIRNTWTHEMRNVSALLDAGIHAGVQVLAQGNGTTETQSGVFELQLLPQQRFALFEVEVPPTAQSVHFELVPGGRFAHDLDMEIYPPGAQQPCPGVQDGGAGRPDTATFAADNLAGTGPGTWNVLVRPASSFDVPEDVPFQLTVEIATDPAGSALAWGGNAAPGETVTVRWPVAFPGDAAGMLGLKVQYISYYDHAGSEPDIEFLHHLTGVQVETRQGVPRFTDVQEEEPPKDAAVPGLALAAPGGLLGAALCRRRSHAGPAQENGRGAHPLP